jgi:hypothetical protein
MTRLPSRRLVNVEETQEAGVSEQSSLAHFSTMSGVAVQSTFLKRTVIFRLLSAVVWLGSDAMAVAAEATIVRIKTV